jgi:hypothetical protein
LKSGRGKRSFCSPEILYGLWDPKKLTFRGAMFLSPEVKQPVREADNSPISNADVKNKWSYTLLPTILLHAVVKDFTFFFHQGIFLFYFLFKEVSSCLDADSCGGIVS